MSAQAWPCLRCNRKGWVIVQYWDGDGIHRVEEVCPDCRGKKRVTGEQLIAQIRAEKLIGETTEVR